MQKLNTPARIRTEIEQTQIIHDFEHGGREIILQPHWMSRNPPTWKVPKGYKPPHTHTHMMTFSHHPLSLVERIHRDTIIFGKPFAVNHKSAHMSRQAKVENNNAAFWVEYEREIDNWLEGELPTSAIICPDHNAPLNTNELRIRASRAKTRKTFEELAMSISI